MTENPKCNFLILAFSLSRVISCPRVPFWKDINGTITRLKFRLKMSLVQSKYYWFPTKPLYYKEKFPSPIYTFSCTYLVFPHVVYLLVLVHSCFSIGSSVHPLVYFILFDAQFTNQLPHASFSVSVWLVSLHLLLSLHFYLYIFSSISLSICLWFCTSTHPSVIHVTSNTADQILIKPREPCMSGMSFAIFIITLISCNYGSKQDDICVADWCSGWLHCL